MTASGQFITLLGGAGQRGRLRRAQPSNLPCVVFLLKAGAVLRPPNLSLSASRRNS